MPKAHRRVRMSLSGPYHQLCLISRVVSHVTGMMSRITYSSSLARRYRSCFSHALGYSSTSTPSLTSQVLYADSFMYGIAEPCLLLHWGDVATLRAGFPKHVDAWRRANARVREGMPWATYFCA